MTDNENTWTVGELKAELDNYGDHLLVRVLIDRGESDIERDFTLETGVLHDSDGDIVTGIQLQVEP